MNNQLTVSSSPHIRCNDTTRRIMLDVLIALLPTTVAGCVIFGLGALAVIAASVIGALLSEFLFNLITKRENSLGDLSAAVTGLILALNLHANTPWWQCLIGSAFAIVVVKCLFGGLGHNFANPAVTGRIFLLISFAGSVGGAAFPTVVDLEATSTPLETLASGAADSLPSLTDMFIGLRGGAIGEVCLAAILLGCAYLVLRRVIRVEVPLAFVLTVFLLSLILTNDPKLALYHIMSGGLLFGAVFMATDYVTTPITRTGKIVFAVGCGIITVLIRFYGSYPEGVSFSILLMNILSPYIEKWTAKKPLGGKSA